MHQINRSSQKTNNRNTISYSIRHDLPGRVRFDIPLIIKRENIASFFEEESKNKSGIFSLRTSSLTGSVLVYYDPQKLSPKKIINYLLKIISTFKEKKKADTQPACTCGRSEKEGESSLLLPFAGILITGGILAFSLLRTLFRRGPIPLRLVSKITSVTAIISGIPIFLEGITYMIKERKLSLDFLVSMAAILSIKMGEGLTALEVTWLMNCGTLLEEYTAEKSRRAIKELIQIGDDEVWILGEGGVEIKISLDAVKEDDIVCVHTGEKISVDGTIISGEGSVNQASITGESIPVYKKEGDTVFAGTLIEQGYLQIKVSKVGDDTYLARVIHMVEESLDTRAPIESISDKFATIFVPSAFLFSIGVYLVTRDFYRAMTVLVTACPCAAAIATPTAVSAAIGNAARKNILVKGGIFIEEASQLDTICLDKTGTVTAGRPAVATVITSNTLSNDEVLAYAASAELRFSHPLGLAIVSYAKEKEIDIPEPESCELKTGKGIMAVMKNGASVAVGSHLLMKELETDVDEIDGEIDALMDRGESIVYVAYDNKVVGVIGVLDNIRPEAAKTILQLRDSGIKDIVLITGDNRRTAQAVSRMLNLDSYYYEVLPEDKAKIIDKLIKEGKEVGMVGDGINDALAFSHAHLGIAMGAGGSEIAVETADISLTKDELTGLFYIRRLSQRTIEIIKQNYGFSMAMNALGISLGSLGVISPLAGGILHIMNSLGVIVNSSRLLNYKPR